MEEDEGTPAKRKTGFPAMWSYLLIIIFVAVLFSLFFDGNFFTKEITWQEFEKDLLLKNKVKSLDVLNGEIVQVYLKPEELPKDKTEKSNSPAYTFRIGSVESFEKRMEDIQKDFSPYDLVPIKYVKKKNWLIDGLPWVLPLILVFLLWRYLFSKAMSNTDGIKSVFNFGKSSATIIEKKKDLPNFKDVAGYEEAKLEILEIVDFLKNPGAFTKLGAKIPKGVLLVGPPGTGKTLMAKAIAGEAGVPFFSLSGSEFVEMFVGVGASRVRDLFRIAKTKAPCIIFIDELDTVGRYREKAASFRSNDEQESTLNQLLSEMDGFGSDTRIIVLAASNRPDILDPALVRAGRFDRHVHLELPNKNERIAIFKVHMKPLKYDSETVKPEFLSSQTPGFSGADIANVCNEAALIAARQKKEMIALIDFSEAIEKIIGGLEKKSAIVSEKEKKIIAYHEAGHAIVSRKLSSIDPIIKLSIIPRGKSLGSTWYLPEEKRIVTKKEFEDNLCAALGGRAAEEIKFNELSSGALDDLERVTKSAYKMVAMFGFDKKLGAISYYDSTGRNENSFHKPFSEATGRIIDESVRAIIENAYIKTKEIISAHTEELEKLAKALLEKETLNENEITKIMEPETLVKG